MTYIAKVVWYNDFSEKEEKVNCFVPATSYKDAMETLTNYFGDEDIITVYLEVFAPDNFLMFDDANFGLFDEVVKKIGENVIW